MEFNFNINIYFKDEITKIGSRLIPDGFIGDRREVQDCLSKVSYILTILGEKSAKAQGLQKVITSGEKLRNSDHVVYVLIDPKGGSRGFGTVVGMLKIGVKHLYVFDAGGNNHEVSAKCVLDFYVHESKQRMGLGKKLFQHMLKSTGPVQSVWVNGRAFAMVHYNVKCKELLWFQEERVDPVHLAIDKPSSKFLSFLLKHYGLQKVIPQMNNFVVFDGFFSNRLYGEAGGEEKKLAAGVSSVGGRYSSGSSGYGLPSSPRTYHCQSVSSVNINNSSYYGRQAPHKPVSTMGMILQQKPPPSQQPPQNVSGTGGPGAAEPPQPAEAEAGSPGDREDDQSAPPVPPDEEQPGPVTEVGPPSATPATPTESSGSHQEPEAVSEKARVPGQGHLDLKFHHSSLW